MKKLGGNQSPKSRRKSRQREVIFEELSAVKSHPTAVELHDLVRKRLPRVSLGTVYRNLELLAQLGMVEKLEHAGGEARFDANLAEHDHLRCVECGRVDDLLTAPLELASPEGHHLRGYELLGHRLEYIGVCPHCRQASATGRNNASRPRLAVSHKETCTMLKANIQEALNNQINAEIASAYLYLSMAAYLEAKNFRGLAKWMELQAREEWSHAMKIYVQVNDRGGRVILKQIDAPQSEWKSVLDVFEHTLAHEIKITEKIHAILKLAISESDFASQAFLQWFVTEQVEEESATTLIVEKLRLSGESHVGLIILDGELGKRVAA